MARLLIEVNCEKEICGECSWKFGGLNEEEAAEYFGCALFNGEDLCYNDDENPLRCHACLTSEADAEISRSEGGDSKCI